MSLHAELYGELHRAAPMVLLHGFGGMAGAWTTVAKALAAELPVIAYDLPGHGRSLSVEPAGGAHRIASSGTGREPDAIGTGRLRPGNQR